MGKISLWRVVAGGILAGAVIMGGHLAGGYLFAVQIGADRTVMLSVQRLFPLWSHIPEFLFGILIAWLYAAIRPRMGAGPRTGIIAGSVAWLAGYMYPWAPLVIAMPKELLSIAMPKAWLAGGVAVILWSLAGCVVAGWLAGWVYREKRAGRRRR